MDPKISHRCTACGASIRAEEQFCPQCGEEVNKLEAGDSLKDATAKPDTAAATNGERAKRGSTAPTQPFIPDKLPFVTDDLIEDEVMSAPQVGTVAVASKTETHSDTGQSKRKRVKDAAREIVDENVRPRVEKLRHASSVVFEEAAAIDPSLRFILIAVFLFIVFIVMLALSFVR